MLGISRFSVPSKTWRDACRYVAPVNVVNWHIWIMPSVMASSATAIKITTGILTNEAKISLMVRNDINIKGKNFIVY